jgi:hypothetical protein
MTPPQLVQALAVMMGLLSGGAWAKSAMLQIRPHAKPDLLDRISRNPTVWNAIAAFLAAGTAIAVAIVMLMTMPR